MSFYVYILRSNTLNRFYTGYTSDVDVRLQFHHNAAVRKFTGKADDWKLFFKIECASKQQAASIEAHIKRMKSATYIKNLAQYPEMSEKLLEKYKDC